MKRNSKHIFALVLALLMAAAMFTGCSAAPAEATDPASVDSKEQAASEAADSAKPYAGKTIQILMEDVPDCAYIQQLVPQFEEETGIKVNIESISYSTMHEKIASQMISAKNSYDVIVVDCYWTGEFIDAGWMLPLDDYISNSGMDMSVYLDSIMKMNGDYEGVTYQLPYYNYCMCLVYNKEIWNNEELKAAYTAKYPGDELTVNDITVEKYLQEVEFISDYYGKDEIAGLVQQGMRGDPMTIEWLNWFFGCGGDWFNANGKPLINSEAAIKAINMYKEALEKASPTGAGSFNLDDAQMVMANGKAASMINYNWQVAALNSMQDSQVAGNLALAKTPGGVAFNGTWGWAIPHNASDPDLSWQFLQWVESFDIAKERALLGGAPSRSDVFNDADVLAKYPYYATVCELIDSSIGMPIVKDSTGMMEALATGLAEAVAGEEDAQKAMDGVYDFMANMG